MEPKTVREIKFDSGEAEALLKEFENSFDDDQAMADFLNEPLLDKDKALEYFLSEKGVKIIYPQPVSGLIGSMPEDFREPPRKLNWIDMVEGREEP